jgi:hypothetical protein
MFLLFALMLSFSRGAVAVSQSEASCRNVGFLEHEPGSETYDLDSVEGQAVFAPSAEPQKLGAASGVCVVLFNRNDRRRVSAVATGEGGRFGVPGVVPGEYVLIASRGAFDDIVIPVRINGDAQRDQNRERGILLHMRPRGDSRKSFVTMIDNLALRRELLNMASIDQALRGEMVRKGFDVHDGELESRMAATDAHNTTRVQEIIKRYRWPGPDLVGIDGTEAAFLIALSGQSYALLLDRILVREGKPQVYGTQARDWRQWATNVPTFEPIEDEVNVDQRRAQVGLPPLSEYREFLKRLYFCIFRRNEGARPHNQRLDPAAAVSPTCAEPI